MRLHPGSAPIHFFQKAVSCLVKKQLALATFLGQAYFNKVFISVFISAFLVHLKKLSLDIMHLEFEIICFIMPSE
jgi:hypothetical protein